jgi:hypothetical protein
MMKNWRCVFLMIILSVSWIAACGTSQAELDAQSTEVARTIYSTQTQIAKEIFATQTAAVPTSTSTATFTETPTNTATATLMPMKKYESGQYPFRIEIPAGWNRLPDQIGLTATFGDSSGGMSVMIAEEDLNEIGTGELTLDEYTDLILFNISGMEGFQILEREKTVNANGVPIMILETSFGPNGIYHTKRLIYLHENVLAFNVTYIAFKENFEDLLPLIEQSFDSFQYVE